MKNSYNFNIAGFCEIDKNAAKAYSIIHNVSPDKNFCDITKIKAKELPYINVLSGGSPCQDFSNAGQRNGALWHCIECGEKYNPLTVHYTREIQINLAYLAVSIQNRHKAL